MKYLLAKYKEAYALANSLLLLDSFPPTAGEETKTLVDEVLEYMECCADLIADSLPSGENENRFKENQDYRNRVLASFSEDLRDIDILLKFIDNIENPRNANGRKSIPIVTEEPAAVRGLVNYCIAHDTLGIIDRVETILAGYPIDGGERIVVIRSKLSDWGNETLQKDLFPELMAIGRFTHFLGDKEFQEKVLRTIAESRTRKRWLEFCEIAAGDPPMV